MSKKFRNIANQLLINEHGQTVLFVVARSARALFLLVAFLLLR